MSPVLLLGQPTLTCWRCISFACQIKTSYNTGLPFKLSCNTVRHLNWAVTKLEHWSDVSNFAVERQNWGNYTLLWQYEKRLFANLEVYHFICINFVNFVNHVVIMVIFFFWNILWCIFYFILLLVFFHSSRLSLPCYFCSIYQAFSWKTIFSDSFVEKRIYFSSCKVPGDNGKSKSIHST